MQHSAIAPCIDPSARPDGAAALTLLERVELIRAHGAPAGDPGLAARRLAEWRAWRPLDDPAEWAEHLRSLGVSEEELRAAIAAPPGALAERASLSPPWATALRDSVLGEVVAAGGEAGGRWASLLHPLARLARGRLRAFAASLARTGEPLPFRPGRVDTLFVDDLLGRLTELLAGTLTLALQRARSRGLLYGETPEQRFDCFVRCLQEPGSWIDLFREYAAAGRLVTERVQQWESASAEMLQRLVEDQDLLRHELNSGRALGELVSVRTHGVGDRHREGRSVSILTFSSGLRVVYKPRCMAADRAFFGLLAWLNDQNACPPLRLLAVVDRGTHGWQEFVEPGGCESPRQVEWFYRRLGGLLALLHVLHGTDMHLENLIAAGDQPVLVDLETLFHVPPHELGAAWTAGAPAPDEPHSVLDVGLLPERSAEGAGGAVVDASAIGAANRQPVWHGRLQLEGVGTDTMRLTRVQATLTEANNQPRLRDEAVRAAEYGAALEKGFAGVYHVLQQQRAVFTREGLLAPFSGAVLRVILRPTRVYGRLLQAGNHPDFLRDALDRDRLFAKLRLAVAARPVLGRVIAHEHAALLRGDIPRFTTRPDSRDVWTDAGDPLPELLSTTGFERVAGRLAALGERDLARQRALIQTSMAMLGDAP